MELVCQVVPEYTPSVELRAKATAVIETTLQETKETV